MAFELALGVVALVQFALAVVLFEFGPEAVRRRVALGFGRVVRRRDAGAVRGAGRQRFAVSQDVFNEKRRSGSPGG